MRRRPESIAIDRSEVARSAIPVEKVLANPTAYIGQAVTIKGRFFHGRHRFIVPHGMLGRDVKPETPCVIICEPGIHRYVLVSRRRGGRTHADGFISGTVQLLSAEQLGISGLTLYCEEDPDSDRLVGVREVKPEAFDESVHLHEYMEIKESDPKMFAEIVAKCRHRLEEW